MDSTERRIELSETKVKKRTTVLDMLPMGSDDERGEDYLLEFCGGNIEEILEKIEE